MAIFNLKSLSSRIALSFAVFAVLGSAALAWWMLERDQRDSRRLFLRLAETNAGFVRDSNLPRSEKLASNLSEVLKMRVGFRSGGSVVSAANFPDLRELASDGRVLKLTGNQEAVAMRLDEQWEMLFVRDSEGVGARFFQKSTLVPIGLFVSSCMVLGYATSRNLVRPLAELARSIPEIESSDAKIPALERADEIGHLARTFERTRRELLEERQRREQSEKLAILGRMATGLAHEIRNPVAAIRMHAQILDGGTNEGSRGLIVSESEKIENLVNQWMFLARPESPQRKIQDLRACVRTTLKVLKPAADHAGVEFEADLPEPLMCSVDAQRMEQVMRNVVINAIHAMPEGGRLRVYSEKSDGDHLSVIFQDEGAGFSEEALSRHGEMFFSTKEGGMGIGLTVAEEITRAHGGELRVKNKDKGRGACVEIILPV